MINLVVGLHKAILFVEIMDKYLYGFINNIKIKRKQDKQVNGHTQFINRH